MTHAPLAQRRDTPHPNDPRSSRSDILDVLADAGFGGFSGFSALLDFMTARGEMDQ